MLKLNEAYADVAEVCLAKYEDLQELAEHPCRIAFLSSDRKKKTGSRTIFAECKKVSGQYEWCCDYDFMIVVYEPNCTYFMADQVETLIRHELNHIGVDETDGSISYYIKGHDFEDFYAILKDKGIDWNKEDDGQLEFKIS